MKYLAATVVVATLAAEHVTATDLWGSIAEKFGSVTNRDNRCKPLQEQGFTWDELSGIFDSYGDLNFDGFTSEDSFGEPGTLRKRTFQEKCITGSVSKDGEGPKIFSNDDVFSIKEFDVSVDVDTDIEFQYGMEDGSICRQTARCSAGGSVIRNNQCGGAKSVTFKVPQTAENDSCKLGIHKIDFDCNPPEPTVTPEETTSNSAQAVPITSADASQSTVQPTPEVFPSVSETPIFANSSSPAEQETPTATGDSTTVQPPPSETSVDQSSVPADSTTATTPPLSVDSVTQIVRTTVTTCQPGETVTSDGVETVLSTTSISTVFITETSTVCTKCVPETTNAPSSAVEQSTPVLTEAPSTSVEATPTAPVTESSSVSESLSSSATETVSSPATETLPADIVTSVVKTTVTTCLPGETVTSEGSTIVLSTTSLSTITLTETSTVCTKCAPDSTAVPTSTVEQSVPVTSETSSSPAEETVPVISETTSTEVLSTPLITDSASVTTEPTLVPTDASSAVETLPESIVTEVVRTTVTTCTPGETITEGEVTTVLSTTSISTITVTETSTVCTKCAPPTTLVPSATESIPVETAPSETTSVDASVPPSQDSSIVITPTATGPGASSSVATPPDSTITEVVKTTVTTCTPGETVTSDGVTSVLTTPSVSTIIITETSTICNACTATPTNIPDTSDSPQTSEVPETTGTPTVPETTVTSEIPEATETPVAPETPENTVSSEIPEATETPVTPEIPETTVTPEIPEATETPVTPEFPETPVTPVDECPDVLPKCLNTWIYQTGCKDNTDTECYCKQAEFTKSVMDCVASWGVDDVEIQEAISYMTGICAAHIAENPGLVTDCPTGVTLAVPTETSAASTSADAAVPVVPYTTLTVQQTVTVPCTFSTGESQGLTIPATSTVTTIMTTIAVPQVQFATSTVSSAPGATVTRIVELAPATAAPVPAQSNVAAPVLLPTTYAGASTLGTVFSPRPTNDSVPLEVFRGAGMKVSAGSFGTFLVFLVGFFLL